MRNAISVLMAGSVLAMSGAGAVGDAGLGDLAPWESVLCGPAGDAVDLVRAFPDPTEPGAVVIVHALCYAPLVQLDTDCTSNAYDDLGYKWNAKYSAKYDPSGSGLDANGVGSAFGSSGSTWDAATSASIWGGVTQNSGGSSAGKKDGTNQFGWKNLGANTIAVTYTWSSGGVATESDAKYNKQFGWSLSGQAGKMDLQNIATHELGHTYGLGHPANTQANECLTMYAYADYGETQKRTLGDGDITGIKALYN